MKKIYLPLVCGPLGQYMVLQDRMWSFGTGCGSLLCGPLDSMWIFGTVIVPSGQYVVLWDSMWSFRTACGPSGQNEVLLDSMWRFGTDYDPYRQNVALSDSMWFFGTVDGHLELVKKYFGTVLHGTLGEFTKLPAAPPSWSRPT